MNIKNQVARDYINAMCIIIQFLGFFIPMDKILNKIYQVDDTDGQDSIP